jgi:hypothetical protein
MLKEQELEKNVFFKLTTEAICKWIDFFKQRGIRVKTYGNLSQLDKIDTHRLNLPEKVEQNEQKKGTQ